MNHSLTIGVAGWSYPDWRGIVYPAGVKDELRYLCRFVDCIEINSTFYRLPEKRLSRSWLERTRDKEQFFFTAKLHRDFTHQGRMDKTMVKDFHRGFEPLVEAGKLRYLLMQFRYDFEDRTAHRDYLQRLVAHFAETFTVVVEIRHRSWESPDAWSYLKGLGVIVANIDYPLGRDSFQAALCTLGQSGYFRLHGRNAEKWFTRSTRDETYDYYYRPEELKEIQGRITNLLTVYPSLVVIANNHYRGAAVANALELKGSLQSPKVPVPEALMVRYPHLAAVASNPPLL